MPGPVFLEGQTVSLRPIEREDAEFLQGGVTDPQVRPWLTAVDPVSAHEEREWLESIGDTEVHLLVCVDEQPVGIIGMEWDRTPVDVAEVGYWIDPDHWGNGYATEALDLFCSFAFEERNMHKLRARAFEGNTASTRVLESAGFQPEGTLREEGFLEGESVDVAVFGLLAREWD